METSSRINSLNKRVKISWFLKCQEKWPPFHFRREQIPKMKSMKVGIQWLMLRLQTWGTILTSFQIKPQMDCNWIWITSQVNNKRYPNNLIIWLEALQSLISKLDNSRDKDTHQCQTMWRIKMHRNAIMRVVLLQTQVEVISI